MKILSIETSCDETGISLLECSGGVKNPTFKVLANALSSQAKLHSPYGGVYPNLAKREHIKNLPILLEKISKKTKLKKPDVIAVTSGPGLEPALWTGIVFAQELYKKWNVPVVPVNHMEGHIISPFGSVKGNFKIPKINFPAISLLVSGGHTELILIKDWMDYKLIGETLDDAAGEAFDKVARMMELPYPGGPEISKIAEERRTLLLKKLGSATARARGIFQQENIRVFQEQGPEISLPRPMLKSKNYDFSFSGLKTAVLYLIKKINSTNELGKLDEKTKSKIALEFENAIVETLVYKTKKAMEEYKSSTLIIAGGVASNTHLKRVMKKELGKKINILLPGKGLATDNSIMIGMVGYMKYLKKGGKFGNPKNIKAEGGLRL
ncbi:MAG: tRNA (adenosine(37)-N6)-threonylcarbamoyltransferase complex transferase subunit TsaD [Candidatus Pacebacteria bacterium]|nr:tRNA (adenosine(37)-N6)-threonylcarbamoyltransferase complex transferase subunit TsaD [Candidatus Paceibacterota bacterium]MBP9839475.1 tRNA (adenosine(37)-N6)-threonylcarbamoyltransferase complex transferase subunit TsaD [Candidatus Paceibacterota bacterium]